MCGSRIVLVMVLAVTGQLVSGCGSLKQEPPTQERIQQQLKRDAAMREAEDRLEKEKSAGRHK
jgi:hypothetical protein